MLAYSDSQLGCFDAYSDSQLMVNQVQGNYLVKDLRMLAYLVEVKVMTMKIKDFKIRQVLQEENKQVNQYLPQLIRISGKYIYRKIIFTLFFFIKCTQ